MCRAGKRDSGWAWVLWVAIAGIAKTAAVATSSIARINPFRVFRVMAAIRYAFACGNDDRIFDRC